MSYSQAVKEAKVPSAETCLNSVCADQLADDRERLIRSFLQCRQASIYLTASLTPEDQIMQSMPDASPTKWHLAHTTWFFETFILSRFQQPFAWFKESFRVFFNSYYNGIGEQFPRPRRGMLSRPGLDTVLEYREHINLQLTNLISDCDQVTLEAIAPLLVLGINHEQQHQELIVTDIKHALSQNPDWPAFLDCSESHPVHIGQQWLPVAGGIYTCGHNSEGFCFDNELPLHETLLGSFNIAKRPVLNSEWLDFISDGGYEEPSFWLSDGWAWKQSKRISAPQYWVESNNNHYVFTLGGLKPLPFEQPVCHISYYEADAFAQWAGKRLPTELEWEVASGLHGLRDESITGALPLPAREFAGTWEWTTSAYSAYPGFQCAPGAVGEYNGKFMINQMVLRGSSCATPPGHSRTTYRNFFHPSARWQFSGVRLAETVS